MPSDRAPPFPPVEPGVTGALVSIETCATLKGGGGKGGGVEGGGVEGIGGEISSGRAAWAGGGVGVGVGGGKG